MIHCIGDKNSLAVEVKFSRRDFSWGAARLWLNQKPIGSLFDTIPLHGCFVGGLLSLQQKLQCPLTTKQNDLNNQELFEYFEQSGIESENYVDFAVISDFYEIYAYKIENNKGIALWKITDNNVITYYSDLATQIPEQLCCEVICFEELNKITNQFVALLNSVTIQLQRDNLSYLLSNTKLIGNKNTFAIEYIIDPNNFYFGGVRLWLNNNFLGSLCEDVDIKAFFDTGLINLRNAPLAEPIFLQLEPDELFAYLDRKVSEYDKSHLYLNETGIKYQIDLYEINSSFTLYAYRLDDSKGALIWRLNTDWVYKKNDKGKISCLYEDLGAYPKDHIFREVFVLNDVEETAIHLSNEIKNIHN